MLNITAANRRGNRRIDDVDLVELLEWLHQNVVEIVTVTQVWVGQDH